MPYSAISRMSYHLFLSSFSREKYNSFQPSATKVSPISINKWRDRYGQEYFWNVSRLVVVYIFIPPPLSPLLRYSLIHSFIHSTFPPRSAK